MVGALLSTAIGAAFSPSSVGSLYFWLFVTFVPLTVAQAAILVMLTQMRSGAAPSIASGYTLALAISPTFITASVIYAGSFLVSVSTIILIPLALFLVARWSLYGPAVVVERSSSARALTWSWRLTQGRGMRTFGVQALMVAARAIAELLALGIAAAVGGGTGPEIIASGLMVALVQPLWMSTNLLLFEDYRRLAGEPQSDTDAGPGAPPSIGPSAMEPTDDLRGS